ncbi:1-deoxy-D-xylulose-5-phosphate synthase N-terminal domain-containing protein [Streptomyces smyrnaeus]|uniref:1-deoxy-D-xylulose-5-phosphate synthase N-terminal domain-containing protein n=1 Tax=Streptomyces smyrnaeus TaxID=1387713 RepID=UPI0036C8EC84
MTADNDSDISMVPVQWSPQALRAVPPGTVTSVAAQGQSFPVEHLCATAGYLGPNPGVVELPLVMHRVFYSPINTLIFDSGHQACVDKLITGRAQLLDRLRARPGHGRAMRGHLRLEALHASGSPTLHTWAQAGRKVIPSAVVGQR